MLALVLALLTAADDADTLRGLPPHDYAIACWTQLGELERYYQREMSFGGTYAERVGPVLAETTRLREWWGHAADAVGYPPEVQWAKMRLWHARAARAAHDWQLYGWPPPMPYWRLPVWSES